MGNFPRLVPQSRKEVAKWRRAPTSSAAANAAEQAGVDPRRLGAVGYGEFRPVASNSTPEGRARNRRIAITILSDEMVGADTVPTAARSLPRKVEQASSLLPEPDTVPTAAGGIPLPPPRTAGPTNVPAASQTAVVITNVPAAPPTAAEATTNVPPDASATPTNAPVTK